jgi:hypothetical protein
MKAKIQESQKSRKRNSKELSCCFLLPINIFNFFLVSIPLGYRIFLITYTTRKLVPHFVVKGINLALIEYFTSAHHTWYANGSQLIWSAMCQSKVDMVRNVPVYRWYGPQCASLQLIWSAMCQTTVDMVRNVPVYSWYGPQCASLKLIWSRMCQSTVDMVRNVPVYSWYGPQCASLQLIWSATCQSTVEMVRNVPVYIKRQRVPSTGKDPNLKGLADEN